LPNPIDPQTSIQSRIPPEVQRKLARRKKNAEKRGLDFKLNVPRQAEPRNIERQLMREYSRYFGTLFTLVEERLLPRLEPNLEEFKSKIPKTDDLADDIAIAISGIKIQFSEAVPEFRLRQMVKNMGLAVSAHNLRQFRGMFKQVVEVDPFTTEPWLEEQVGLCVEQNVGLITTVEERFFGEIQEIVFRGARQGLPTQEISQMIRERARVTKSRADLIARDQINKFNGQLTQLRQESVGVKKYRWRTSLDERVRPLHSSREGKEYDWSSPPSDGHPGEPINCRCFAEPILEDFVEEEG